MRIMVFVISLLFAAPAWAQGACPELSTLQHVAGFITLANIGMVFAIILGVLCAVVLLYHLPIPVQVYESFGYIAAVAFMGAGYFLSPINEVWTSLIGCLLFGGMMILSGIIHKLETNYVRFFGTLFVLWTAVATFYLNHYVGFIAVAAFMGMLGFTAAIIPFGYAVGFQDEDALARATPAALLTLAIFVVLRIVAERLPNADLILPYTRVFEQGALWLGSFVGYLGLLILSTVWYKNRRRSYGAMQFVTVCFGVVAIVVGSLFGIPQLLGIGGTFFALYLVEKPFEIPAGSVPGYALIGLMVALGIGGATWWAQNHMELVRPFLVF